jgi:hypothetical protein
MFVKDSTAAPYRCSMCSRQKLHDDEMPDLGVSKRGVFRFCAAFIASIAENGVLIPITASDQLTTINRQLGSEGFDVTACANAEMR